MVEMAGGLGVLALSLRWARLQPLSLRLLAMLHVGFTWLGIALLLSGVDQALAVAGDTPAGFALASTHAFTMGFLGSTLIAMVTRVTCAQGGRAVAADDVVWRLFWVLQLAIVARLGAALAGPVSAELGQALVGAAATGWAGVCIAWAVRCSRWYGLPRAEGRKGSGRASARGGAWNAGLGGAGRQQPRLVHPALCARACEARAAASRACAMDAPGR
jgi:uncharacterized protein involved in response to NO